MSLEKLKELLDRYFNDRWVMGYIPKGSNLLDDYAILNFIDSYPQSADDEIVNIYEMYQLSYYSSDFEKNIDDFFINNNIMFENRRQVFLDDLNIYQNTYDIYIYK